MKTEINHKRMLKTMTRKPEPKEMLLASLRHTRPLPVTADGTVERSCVSAHPMTLAAFSKAQSQLTNQKMQRLLLREVAHV
ncbi:MAG: hypothetical protein AAF250_16080 [Pseudomonadota bacterium]